MHVFAPRACICCNFGLAWHYSSSLPLSLICNIRAECMPSALHSILRSARFCALWLFVVVSWTECAFAFGRAVGMSSHVANCRLAANFKCNARIDSVATVCICVCLCWSASACASQHNFFVGERSQTYTQPRIFNKYSSELRLFSLCPFAATCFRHLRSASRYASTAPMHTIGPKCQCRSTYQALHSAMYMFALISGCVANELMLGWLRLLWLVQTTNRRHLLPLCWEIVALI